MNKTQQILQQRRELFEKEFVEERTPIENTKGEFTCKVIASAKNIKSFHATTISLLLNSLKEEAGKLPRYDVYDGGEAESEDGDYFKLNDVLTFLSETISKIQTK